MEDFQTFLAKQAKTVEELCQKILAAPNAETLVLYASQALINQDFTYEDRFEINRHLMSKGMWLMHNQLPEKQINEEDLVFNKGEQQRLADLRVKRLREQLEKEDKAKLLEFNKDNTFKKGDPIFVVLDGTEFSGFINSIEVNEEGQSEFFTAATPHGVLTDLSFKNIKRRIVDDLTGVVVPEHFKKMTTKQLLRELQVARGHSDYNDYAHWFRHSYDIRQLKAELATREHIPNKRENAKVRELKAKMKK